MPCHSAHREFGIAQRVQSRLLDLQLHTTHRSGDLPNRPSALGSVGQPTRTVDRHALSNCVMNNPSTHSFIHSMLIHSLNLTVMPWVSWISASPWPLLLLAMLGRNGASREGSIRVGRGDPACDRHHISWPLRYWLGEISFPASLGRGRLHHGRPCRIISPALLPNGHGR
jgi:hypothetical protein